MYEVIRRGAPGYHTSTLLKLYLYGYIYGIRSSRKLESETKRNIEVIWLLRKLQPDFKTIADFRKDNKSSLKNVFKDFTLLCKQLERSVSNEENHERYTVEQLNI